jgi:hypothetical protein
VVGLVLSVPLWAVDEFVVPGGQWRTMVSTSGSFMPTPVTRTHTECRQETTFDPTQMMQKAGECSLVDQTVEGNELVFSLRCRTEAGELTGTGQYQLEGERVQGSMDLQMNAAGQALQMRIEFSGERLGDC